MTTLDEALAARRAALVAALYDHPAIRDKLSHSEIVMAVDTAFDAAAIPALLTGLVAAQAVVAAVQADVPTPPTSVTGAIGDYAPARDDIVDRYGDFYDLA